MPDIAKTAKIVENGKFAPRENREDSQLKKIIWNYEPVKVTANSFTNRFKELKLSEKVKEGLEHINNPVKAKAPTFTGQSKTSLKIRDKELYYSNKKL
jgi:hypothetical protein